VLPLTIFTVPKPFAGDIDVIQQNAIESWTRLGDGIEIVLCGDEDGVAETADRFGIRYVPNVGHNEHGTPLLDSVFRLAREASRSPRLAYVNTDVILLGNFRDAAARLPVTHLMVGRRWNLDVSERLAFAGDWEDALRARIAAEGRRAEPVWIDYFVFGRDSPLADVPPFAVGRPRWDNWMIFRARSLGIPVTDATAVVDAVHQNHGHGHVPEGTGELWYGPEAQANHALAGRTPMLSTLQATHVMTRSGPRPALSRPYLAARWKTRNVVDGRFERLARRAGKLYGMRSRGA
jgi:hypothetical protein